MKKHALGFCVYVCLLALSPAFVVAEPLDSKRSLAGPNAALRLDETDLLLVSGSKSRSLFALDTGSLTVREELPLDGEPRALASVSLKVSGGSSQGDSILVLTAEPDELLEFRVRDGRCLPEGKIGVGRDPTGLIVSTRRRAAFVSSRWGRSVSRVALQALSTSTISRPKKVVPIALPFAARRMIVLEEVGKLVVAGAFAADIAVVDLADWRLESVRRLPGHNVSAIVSSPDGAGLLLTQQLQDSRVETSYDGIHWGGLVQNVVRFVTFASLLDAETPLTEESRVIRLDTVGHGAADPSALAVGPRGQLVVALAGVNEIAVTDDLNLSVQRRAVGRRPVDVVLERSGEVAYVVENLQDAVSVFDLRRLEVKKEIRLRPERALSPVERGERAFYDAAFSHHNWLTCHSCHTEGHSNGQLADTLGDESYGAPKRVLSLLGVGDTAPWAWNGSVGALDEQVRKSLVSTMHVDFQPKGATVDALTAFLRSLSPPPPVGAEDRTLAGRGEVLFGDLGCRRCHESENLTSVGAYDVGLRDEAGNRRFNPPSLRGVSQRSGWFHDRRAKTLGEVIRRYQHQLDRGLSADEEAALLAYLRTL